MIIQNKDQLIECLDVIKAAKIIAYDLEATGTNVRKDRVIGIGISDERLNSFYLPLMAWNNKKQVLEDLGTRIFAEDLLQALKGKRIIAHNASYDIRATKNDLGVDLSEELYADTIMLKHTVDELPPFGLKQLGKRLFGVDAVQEQKEMQASVKKNGGVLTKKNYELYKGDMELIGKYCEQDCKLTVKVFDYYSILLAEKGLESFFYEEEVMPLYKLVTMPMEDNGVRVDVDKLKRTKVDIEKDMAIYEERVQNKLGPLIEPLKQDLLMKLHGVKNKFKQGIIEFNNWELPKTPSGKYRMSKGIIEGLPDSKWKTFMLTGEGLTGEEIMEIQEFIQKQETGSTHFININSRKQLKDLIFGVFKEKPLKFSSVFGSSEPMLDNAMLRSIAHKYDFIDDLIVHQKLLKIRGTYIDRFLDAQEDGIFYPQWKQFGTISGRYSGDLQQLPKPILPADDSDNKIPEIVKRYTNKVREFFIARNGYKFLDNDYESLEPHCFAHASNSKWIQDIFINKQDLYSTVGISAYKLKDVSADKNADNYLKKIYPAVRQAAKAFTLGIPYGMGSFKLSKELDISQEEAQAIIDNYLDAAQNPDGTGLRRYMIDCNNQAIEYGWIKSQLGRMRHFPECKEIIKIHGIEVLDPYQLAIKYKDKPTIYEDMRRVRRKAVNQLNNAKNFPIQSLAASIVNRAAIAMTKQYKEENLSARIVAQIHDQIIVEVSEKDLERAKEIMQYAMEQTVKLDIPLTAVPEVASNFSEGH